MQAISRQGQFRAEPQPFNRDGGWRDQALREQNRAAAAESWQGLEQRGVAQADPGQPAPNEKPKRRAGRARAEHVRPDRQKEKRAGDAPEIRLDAAQPRGGAMAAHRGNGKQQRGEQRGEHQVSVRTVSTRVMSQSPPIFWKVNFISCT